jgi:uncharacterized protein
MKPRGGSTSSVQSHEVRLFSTRDSVVAVDSPIKRRILELASGGPVPFDRIVEETKKAKSTISVHVKDLEHSGLIMVQPDPHDSRKRLIGLSSDAIGTLTNADRRAKIPEHVHRHEKNGELFSEEDIVSFFRYCVRVFRTQAMVMGINLDPVLQQTGIEVGRALAPKIAGKTPEDVVLRMDSFWRAHGLGAITLSGTDPLTLEVRGCFECEDLPVTGHGACAFDIGILTAIFAHHLKFPVTVVEDRCYSQGDDRCIFVITPHS